MINPGGHYGIRGCSFTLRNALLILTDVHDWHGYLRHHAGGCDIYPTQFHILLLLQGARTATTRRPNYYCEAPVLLTARPYPVYCVPVHLLRALTHSLRAPAHLLRAVVLVLVHVLAPAHG